MGITTKNKHMMERWEREEQSSVCTVERGRTGDMMTVAEDRAEVCMLPFPSRFAGVMTTA